VQHDYQETAEGRLFYQMRGAIAEFEKAKILERTARGRRGKIAAGGLPHLIRLYGYRFIKGAGKQAAARDVLVPEPREAAWVRQVFTWCAHEHMAPGEIAAALNQTGVPTKTGRGLWRTTQALRMLQNPAYASGRLTLGKQDHKGLGVARRLTRAQRAEKGLKLTARPRPREAWQQVSVTPLIEDSLWHAAQVALAKHQRRAAPRSPLTGLGRCGLCGSALYYVNASRVACSGRYWGAAPGCTLPAKPRHAVEEAVWSAVRQWLLDPDLLQEATAAAPQNAALEAELGARKAELARLGLLFARGLWPEAMSLPAMEAAQRQIEGLEAQLMQERAAPAALPLEEIAETLNTLENERRTQLIRLAVDHFVMMPSGRGQPPAVTVIPAGAAPATAGPGLPPAHPRR
ncbi:MAG TPA: recombinase family protein, partial [Symbiobacteriaceae bacterium]|nr:recombinase family protein [Symbiobacteriaceae bacterium]